MNLLFCLVIYSSGVFQLQMYPHKLHLKKFEGYLHTWIFHIGKPDAKINAENIALTFIRHDTITL